ncbi:proteasome stabiliser domain-containing protein [Trichoderma pleuroticola]
MSSAPAAVLKMSTTISYVQLVSGTGKHSNLKHAAEKVAEAIQSGSKLAILPGGTLTPRPLTVEIPNIPNPTFSEDEVKIFSVEAVSFLASAAFTDEEKFLPALYASSSPDTRVASLAEEIIKRTSVSLEQEDLAKKLFEAHSRLPAAYRTRILTPLAKSNIASTMSQSIIDHTPRWQEACFNFDPRRTAGNQVLFFSCGGRADGSEQDTNSQFFVFTGDNGPLSFVPCSRDSSKAALPSLRRSNRSHDAAEASIQSASKAQHYCSLIIAHSLAFFILEMLAKTRKRKSRKKDGDEVGEILQPVNKTGRTAQRKQPSKVRAGPSNRAANQSKSASSSAKSEIRRNADSLRELEGPDNS